MRKKLVVLGLILSTLLLFATGTAVTFAAEAAPDKQINLENFNSRAAYLIDYDTGKVLYERDPDERYPIASMVKIMTLNIAFDEIEAGRLSLDQTITVSETAAGMGGSQMFLDAGKDYSVSDLIKGITVVSANDASVAIAETVAGSKEAFIDMMNERAAAMGLENTKFVNVTGLPESGQYSNARDVTAMMRKLLGHPEYFKFSTIYMENFTHPGGRISELVNTNKLVRFYKGCDGGKTGFTNDAMYCLSATAKRGDTRVIATVLGAESSKSRNNEVSTLFNYAFHYYKTVKLLEKGKAFPAELKVEGAKDVTIELAADRDVTALEKRGEKRSYELRFTADEGLKAPVKSGSVIGKVELVDVNSGEVLATAGIVTLNDIEKRSLLDGIGAIFDNWFFGI